MYGRGCRFVRPGEPPTDTELDVLQLVSHGHTNAVIAARLGLTENGVKHILRAIYVRLSARDRAHAVRRGFEHGYLRPDRQQVAP